jgi:mono/diheme cytochrome c family protein
MRRLAVMTLLSCAPLCATGCRGWESEEPPVHLVRNMDTQEKGKAYRRDTSGIWADGRMMRPPVEGTVAQGQLVEDDVLSEGVGPDGQPTLKYPTSIKVDDAFRAHGKTRFDIYCTPCHGVEGNGKGTVAGRGLVVPPPSFFDPRLKTMAIGKIYAAIKNGVNNNNMPPYNVQLPVNDRWATVAYIRQLQMKADPTVAEEGGSTGAVAKANKASVQHGEQLYNAKACVTCHSLDGSKKVGPSFKGIYGKTESTSGGDVKVDDAYIRESVQNPTAKVVNGYPPAMPPMQLDEIEMQSVILFIKAQK